MANIDTVKKVFGGVYFKFPSRRPTVREEFDTGLRMWAGFYADVPDQVLLDAAARFCRTTTKLFPDDCPFAKILEMTGEGVGTETVGDINELAQEAVSRFGRYREDEAFLWLESRSPIAAAAIRRFGFQEYCNSENPEVVRGQLKEFYKEERTRAKTLGAVLDTAKRLEAGKAAKELTGGEAKLLSLVPEGRRIPA
jgi:hypothetical protein